MAGPLVFLPRVVSKHAKPWHGISRSSPSPSPPPDPTTDDSEDSDPEDDQDLSQSHDRVKGKEKAVEPPQSKQSTIGQDIAALVSLAFADYNIWLDSDMRWKLDACLSDDTPPDEAGFVPINYLLRRAPFRGSLPLSSGHPEPSETEVVKALRTHAAHTLEVRMHIPSSSASSVHPSSVWYGTGKTSRKKDVGGYEVRRRDWLMLRHRPSSGWTRARWDDMTGYIEGIPPQYRTIGGIARFANTLFSPTLTPGTKTEPHTYIQNISLLPHYLDKHGDVPKCKGYALITFSTKSHLEAILRTWPWKRRRKPIPSLTKENRDGDEDEDEGENLSPIAKEAYKYGFRAISKARWDALNEEYLLYKQHLVDEIARMQSETHHSGQDAVELERGEPTHVCAQSEQETQPQMRMQTTPTSPYPFDCLVFVRHVHPETNKTTLKSLFSQAFQDDGDDRGDQDRTSAAGLNYVDFTKGMDTCYLRLTSPRHATHLTAYFNARPTAQVNGLDGRGRTPVGNDNSITMALIRGKKEEVYWERVPEKVRRQAVDKAIEVQWGASSIDGNDKWS